jgi:hypothetical protein
VENVGRTSIYDFRALYGEGRISPIPVMRPGAEIQDGFTSGVPNEMRISWRAEPAAEATSVVVPVGKLLSMRPLRRWIVQLDGTNVRVLREDSMGATNPNTMLEPRRSVQVYP